MHTVLCSDGEAFASAEAKTPIGIGCGTGDGMTPPMSYGAPPTPLTEGSAALRPGGYRYTLPRGIICLFSAIKHALTKINEHQHVRLSETNLLMRKWKRLLVLLTRTSSTSAARTLTLLNHWHKEVGHWSPARSHTWDKLLLIPKSRLSKIKEENNE